MEGTGSVDRSLGTRLVWVRKATKNPVFWALAFASACTILFKTLKVHTPYFDPSYSNIVFIVTHFCAQAIFKFPVSNTFPTHKTI